MGRTFGNLRRDRWLATSTCGLWLVLLAMSPPAMAMPPLTDEQRVRLETAYDGRDHQEEAFIALIEHLREWDGDIAGAAVRLQPDVDAMRDDPERFRGEIVMLSGRIAQITTLSAPYDGVREVFIRDAADRPLLIYLVEQNAAGESSVLREGRRIEVFARFYKRADFTARDGQVRRYAAFVGAHPRVAATVTGEFTHLAVLVIAVIAMLVVFLLLYLAVRRQGGKRRRSPSPRLSRESVPPQLDDAADLPDDPAEALRELRRRIDQASDSPL